MSELKLFIQFCITRQTHQTKRVIDTSKQKTKERGQRVRLEKQLIFLKNK